MLQEMLQQVIAQGGLLHHGAYCPAVTLQDRSVWEGGDAQTRQYWIQRGETYLAYAWPRLTADMYAAYHQTGSRTEFEVPYHQRRQALSTLILAEGYENKGRFLPALCAGLTHICDEPTWVLPAHYDNLARDKAQEKWQASQDHAIDLFAAETGNLLAWILYVLQTPGARLMAPVGQRVSQELRQRIIEPYLTRTDFWWMGYDTSYIGNWTTWCTSNCLGVILLMEHDPVRRQQALEKACYALDKFIEAYTEDGGCDEGPMYWNFAGACLFDSLEMLYEASQGMFDVFHQPVIRSIGSYIYKVHIDDLYFINFADSPPRIPVDAALLYRYGKRIGDPHLQTLGKHLYRVVEQQDPAQSIRLKMYRALATLADVPTLQLATSAVTLPQESYFSKLQILVARETDRPGQGLVVAIKGGHNNEGHNHNDVGNVVMYADGQPILIDVGMMQYSKQSFSDQRYDMWAMQSSYHNVPLINDIMQQHGRGFQARRVHYHRAGPVVTCCMDIAGAYPADAGVATWERHCIFDRHQRTIHLREAFAFHQQTNSYELRYITYLQPYVDEAQRIRLDLGPGRALFLHTVPYATAMTVHTIALEDRLLRHAWGPTLYQVRWRFAGVPRQGECLTCIEYVP